MLEIMLVFAGCGGGKLQRARRKMRQWRQKKVAVAAKEQTVRRGNGRATQRRGNGSAAARRKWWKRRVATRSGRYGDGRRCGGALLFGIAARSWDNGHKNV